MTKKVKIAHNFNNTFTNMNSEYQINSTGHVSCLNPGESHVTK